MALDFSKTATNATAAATPAPDTKNELEVVQAYDIVDDRKNMENALVGSAEVDALVSTIAVDDMNSIVTFGSEAASEISKVSDAVLNSMSMSALDESSKMMEALSTIMSKFDLDEIQSEPKGLQKLFTNAKKQLDKILSKYHTMGEEVDKIYIELKKYEDEIKASNKTLTQMFDTNVNTYHTLVKYILAGEQACKEIEAYIAQRQTDFESTGDSSIQFELASLNQALMMMEQRTQDWLKDMKSVAYLIPQGTLVNVHEEGNVHDLVLKSKERLCGRAQLEIALNTAYTIKKIMDNSTVPAVTQYLYNTFVCRDVDSDILRAKCQLIGGCKEPCEFGPTGALSRRI